MSMQSTYTPNVSKNPVFIDILARKVDSIDTFR